MNFHNCTRCATLKPTEEFVKKKDRKSGVSSWCKACYCEHKRLKYLETPHVRLKQNKNRPALRERNRSYVLEYLADKHCMNCQINDSVVLEFHHRDPGTKKFEISVSSGGGYSIESIDAEIAKCDILCANCHRRETAVQQGWYRAQAASQNGRKDKS